MHHRIIGAAFKKGRKWGWIDRNVAEDTTPPSAHKAEIKVPSPEQIRALITEATRPAAKNPELARIVLLAAITGMRRGELCGLQWRDVEWENGAILVGMADTGRHRHEKPQVPPDPPSTAGRAGHGRTEGPPSPIGKRCFGGRCGPVA